MSRDRIMCLDELPVRLAHRVKELDELPHNLSEMSSIRKVKNWYAQSFEVGCQPVLAYTLSMQPSFSDSRPTILWVSSLLTQQTCLLGID